MFFLKLWKGINDICSFQFYLDTIASFLILFESYLKATIKKKKKRSSSSFGYIFLYGQEIYLLNYH